MGASSRLHRAELIAHLSGVAETKEARDSSAEYGSVKRAAVMIDGVVLRAKEEVQPGQRVSRTDRLLERARAVDPDGFMARMVADFDRCQEPIRLAAQRREAAGLERELAAENGGVIWR